MHPDDRDRVDGIVRSSFETLQPFVFSYPGVEAGRDERILDAHGDVFGEDGRIVRMAGTAHDVTERIEVDERLASRPSWPARGQLNDPSSRGSQWRTDRLERDDPEAAEAVHAALERAKELVHDLLGDAPPEPGSLAGRRQPWSSLPLSGSNLPRALLGSRTSRAIRYLDDPRPDDSPRLCSSP